MFQIFNEGKENEFMLNLKCGVMISKTTEGKAWVDSDQLGTSTGVDDSYDSVKSSIFEKERKARIEQMTAQIFGSQLQYDQPKLHEIDNFIGSVIRLAESTVDRIDLKYGD